MIKRAELTILKNIGEHYKYIARDANGDLTVYETKPHKSVKDGIWDERSYSAFNAFKHLFAWVKWDDKEPIKIKDIIKCGVKKGDGSRALEN